MEPPSDCVECDGAGAAATSLAESAQFVLTMAGFTILGGGILVLSMYAAFSRMIGAGKRGGDRGEAVDVERGATCSMRDEAFPQYGATFYKDVYIDMDEVDEGVAIPLYRVVDVNRAAQSEGAPALDVVFSSCTSLGESASVVQGASGEERVSVEERFAVLQTEMYS